MTRSVLTKDVARKTRSVQTTRDVVRRTRTVQLNKYVALLIKRVQTAGNGWAQPTLRRFIFPKQRRGKRIFKN